MSDHPQVPGPPVSTESRVLEGGASILQSFAPLTKIHAHLNAFHTPYHAPGSVAVETSHFCAHLTDDVRQCVLYDSAEPNARLIGVEYMITPALFEGLDEAEKRLWHSHVFEVRSGMLVMPQGAADAGVPGAQQLWETAETRAMEGIIKLYGKVWQTWDTMKPGGEKLPLGEPVLMTSFNGEGQMKDFETVVGERDRRLGTDWRRKKEIRKAIEEFEPDAGADGAWRK